MQKSPVGGGPSGYQAARVGINLGWECAQSYGDHMAEEKVDVFDLFHAIGGNSDTGINHPG
ncbi:MAG: hypothetical protein M0Z94_12255 [Dehalococcoidales bacterium]|nr:hypothetical protein [Dehalococcoidales bacterium]